MKAYTYLRRHKMVVSSSTHLYLSQQCAESMLRHSIIALMSEFTEKMCTIKLPSAIVCITDDYCEINTNAIRPQISKYRPDCTKIIPSLEVCMKYCGECGLHSICVCIELRLTMKASLAFIVFPVCLDIYSSHRKRMTVKYQR